MPWVAEELPGILEVGFRGNVTRLTKDGLVADPRDPTFTKPYVDGIRELMLDDADQQLARQLGLTACAYQAELVWEQTSSGSLQPKLLSPTQHIVLGRLGTDGTFVGTSKLAWLY